jgi:putative ABC transport system permease protein
MSLLEAIRLALGQIRAQKLKSFFTLLGVTIGVMFLIAVVSIVEGMGRYMEQDLVGKLIPVNSFELRRRPNIQLGDVTEEEWKSWQRRPRLRASDVGPVTEALPPGVRWAVYSSDQIQSSTPYSRPRRVEAFAADASYFTLKNMGVTSGRVFTEQEAELGLPVVVIGKDVKDHFFPSLDPVGREIRVGGFPYTVVGVAEPQGSVFGASFDKFIVAPRRAPLQRLVNPHGIIDGVLIQTPSAKGMQDSMERVRQVMRQRRHLRPSQPDDFSMQTSESALAFWNKLKRYLVLAGILLPAIGLVVGAIVIMNIMLVAVAERTREIGIRKSLGARRRDILAQFLIESATLSTLGAAIGVGTGVALAELIAAVSPLPASVAPWSVGVGVLLGAGVGIVAGVYPASRASLLDPITALRQE